MPISHTPTFGFEPKETPKGYLYPKGLAHTLEALNRIQPGQVVVYHTGNLASERHGRDVWCRQVDQIGNRALALGSDQYQGGKKEGRLIRPAMVQLTQIRLRPGKYQYLATGLPRMLRSVA